MNAPLYVGSMFLLFVFIRVFVRTALSVWDDAS